jgi:hypothetical protein
MFAQRTSFRGAPNLKEKINNMKTNRLIPALVIGGLAAIVTVVATVDANIGIESLLGYGAVASLLTVAAIDYGRDLRRSRNH